MNGVLALLRAAVGDALGLWRIAPLIPLLVVVPELLQHRAEAELGMFASRAAFEMLAMAPARWFWGTWKLAALGAAMLAALWWLARRGAAGPVRWPRLGLAIAVGAAVVAVVAGLPGGTLWPGRIMLIGVLLGLASLPLLPLAVGALAGDAELTPGRACRDGWGAALRMVALALGGYLPLQLLHAFNHRIALGLPAGPLWAVLAWDALVVGMMACWLGAALWHGYRGSAAFVKR